MSIASLKLICLDYIRDASGVARVYFNRPSQYNAMNTALMQELILLLQELVKEEDLKLLVLEGRGKAFMAGADIVEYARFSESDFTQFQSTSARIYELIEQAPFPVLAAINGFAVGGGFEIALACDLRVAKPAAKMGLPEVKLGLIPGGGGTQRLIELAGLSVARELLLTGRLYSARDMYNRHLVSEIIEEEVWENRLGEIMDELRVIPRQSIKKIKALTSSALLHESFTQRLNREAQAVNELFNTPVATEKIQSFVQKK
ncbi:enoyl-CoA hydratase/isomerase family protein [Flavihumibacter sp. CACIAM 22H1]|uniref:enoyl-CoA hydratase/isomerase family protein n=1 Tax=Flavihumibacter sp. CACIAM 22H1 TaxID=1812911 RepID=UPI0025BAE978|nr:enoyl-CoA hydratase/isomerase family protein [Flavihumibacter sp. CACIAM 22H1]